MTAPTTSLDPHDTAAVAARLRLSATRLARLLRQQSRTGLTPTQLAALATIERHGRLTLGELAEHEQVAAPTITKVVAKLEAAGYVRKEADPDDRRFCFVQATPAGAALLADSRQRRDAWLADRLDGLDARQRTRLAAALDALEQLTTGAS